MTQHSNPEHTAEDQATMRRLMTVIGAFMVATAVLAGTVYLFMG